MICIHCTEPHHGYDHDASTSYLPDGSSFSILYGSGLVDGFLSTDTVCVAGVCVANQTFGETMIELPGSTFLSMGSVELYYSTRCRD